MINVISKKLNNNAMCYILPKKGYNEKEVMIAFKYGSKNTDFLVDGININQPYGIAHFLEHKMFEDKDINIFDNFSKLGLSANAYTNFDTTAYYFSGCENIDKGFDLLMKMVSSLYVTDENIEKEKGIITQEINMYKDDPYWQIYFNTLKAMYSKNSIRESIAGDVDDIEKITKDNLEESYNNFYTYENCVIIGCGDIDSKKFFEQAENLKLNKAKVKKVSINDKINKKEYAVNMSVNKTIYHIGFRHSLEKNITERITTSNIIMNMLFSPSSKLYERLYNKGLIDSSFGFEVVQGVDYSNTIIKGESNDYNYIASEILNEINNYIINEINNDDLDRIKNRIKTQMIFNSENISSLVSFAADCYSKNTEILDIYNNYDKINKDNIINSLKEQYTANNMVIALVKEIQNGWYIFSSSRNKDWKP